MRAEILNPFDIKTVLFAKHAQHVVMIHFPIALFIIGVLFDFVGQWTKRRVLASAAYCNLFVAALTTIPVVITGILAWQWELEGQRLKGILLMHLVLGCDIKFADLGSLAGTRERRTQAGGSLAGVPFAPGGCSGGDSGIDRPPRRVSQWSEWTRIVFAKD